MQRAAFGGPHWVFLGHKLKIHSLKFRLTQLLYVFQVCNGLLGYLSACMLRVSMWKLGGLGYSSLPKYRFRSSQNGHAVFCRPINQLSFRTDVGLRWLP